MPRATRFAFVLTAAAWLLALPPNPSPGTAAALPLGPAGPEQCLAIIVNHLNPTDDLAFSELRHIFLGEKSHWPNGRRITLVMMEPGQPERRAVLHDVYQMSENDFNNHFLQGLFTGEVFVSPKTLATPIGVRKFIFNVPGAIGYVRASDTDDTVKVIRIDGRLPDDKDYTLRIQTHAGK
jgi:ABC-type phosphate transport system substrate-binding protein